MLNYQDHDWMLVPGGSRVTAYLCPEDRSAEDLKWWWNLDYTAVGPKWRRVQSWHRPRISVEVAHFQPRIRRWTELEQVSFWEHVPYDQEYDGGSSSVTYTPGPPDATTEFSDFGDHLWRIARRDERFLTVEFAGFASCDAKCDALDAAPVLPDGQPAPEDTTADFWKANAQVYLIEQIPFGVVSVTVPRNVRDPEAYALGRTRTLLGLEKPEHLQVTDFMRHPNASANITGELYATLHFHGCYED